MQPQTATDLLVNQFSSFGAAWLLFGAQFHWAVVGSGTVGLAGTHGWVGELQAQLFSEQPHTRWINVLSRSSAAPSHPRLPHVGQQGMVLRQTLWSERREGGRRDVIHDKANSLLLLFSPLTSLEKTAGKNKRLNRIK